MFNNFFFKSYLLWYVEKNIVERDRPQKKTWLLRIAYWITKAKNTPSEYVILITFLQQQWLHERARYYVIRTLSDLLHITGEMQWKLHAGYLGVKTGITISPYYRGL